MRTITSLKVGQPDAPGMVGHSAEVTLTRVLKGKEERKDLSLGSPPAPGSTLSTEEAARQADLVRVGTITKLDVGILPLPA